MAHSGPSHTLSSSSYIHKELQECVRSTQSSKQRRRWKRERCSSYLLLDSPTRFLANHRDVIRVSNCEGSTPTSAAHCDMDDDGGDPFAPAGLRRSEGLLNLRHHRLNTENASQLSQPESGAEGRPALKRPHPFGSSRPSFLTPGSPIPCSPAIHSPVAMRAKRFHMPARLSGPSPGPPLLSLGAQPTPEASMSSFKRAKPLQTAFSGSGLVSKSERSISSSLNASLPIPETPCKNGVATPDASSRHNGSFLGLGERMERFSLSHVASPDTPTRDHSGSASAGPLHTEQNSDLDLLERRSSIILSGSVPGGRAVADNSSVGSLGFSGSQGAYTPMTLHTSTPVPAFRTLSQATVTPGTVRRPSLDMSDSVESPVSTVSSPHTPAVTARRTPDLDLCLARRFESTKEVGTSEFSSVFVVSQGKQRWAVKRSARLRSAFGRRRYAEEVEILRRMSKPSASTRSSIDGSIGGTAAEDDDYEEHVISLAEAWETDSFGYIMTEWCENGDLDRFLAEQSSSGRLEEWRVWKILAELALGIEFIHSRGVLHLDLKPANVFVTFEGQLKIGDFGMATSWPAPAGLEREGDREYIAPEVLERGEYDKPADVFSLGLIMVEVAANIVLPDNGIHWQRLRSGDLSDAGRLSSGDLRRAEESTTIPEWAPRFLVDDSHALDVLVSAMLSPRPSDRPTAEQLLYSRELELVNSRRAAGAVVYEGDYGPAPYEVEPAWRP